MLVANKIDVDYNVVKKEFKFASKHNLPLFYVSAADGTNVVKVFKNVIREGNPSLLTHSLHSLIMIQLQPKGLKHQVVMYYQACLICSMKVNQF